MSLWGQVYQGPGRISDLCPPQLPVCLAGELGPAKKGVHTPSGGKGGLAWPEPRAAEASSERARPRTVALPQSCPPLTALPAGPRPRHRISPSPGTSQEVTQKHGRRLWRQCSSEHVWRPSCRTFCDDHTRPHLPLRRPRESDPLCGGLGGGFYPSRPRSTGFITKRQLTKSAACKGRASQAWRVPPEQRSSTRRWRSGPRTLRPTSPNF